MLLGRKVLGHRLGLYFWGALLVDVAPRPDRGAALRIRAAVRPGVLDPLAAPHSAFLPIGRVTHRAAASRLLGAVGGAVDNPTVPVVELARSQDISLGCATRLERQRKRMAAFDFHECVLSTQSGS